MRARRSSVRAVAALAATCALFLAASQLGACGLDVFGTLPPEGEAGADAVTPPATDAATDATPSCASCAPLPPEWRVVTLAARAAPDPDASLSTSADAGDAGSACPPGATPDAVLRVNPRASGADCTCRCGASPKDPCTDGTLTVDFRTGVQSCNDGTRTFVVDGGCQALPFTWNGGYNGVSGDPLPVVSVACPAQGVPAPIVDDGAFETCAHPRGAGCAPDEACLPAAPDVCVLREGSHACPPGFPTARPLEAAKDSRVCETCACTSRATSCSGARLDFYGNATCTGGSRGASLDGTCNGIGGGGTPTHLRYRAAPDVTGCAPAAATVGVSSGQVERAPVTVCCR